jgi:hypothetical protein
MVRQALHTLSINNRRISNSRININPGISNRSNNMYTGYNLAHACHMGHLAHTDRIAQHLIIVKSPTQNPCFLVGVPMAVSATLGMAAETKTVAVQVFGKPARPTRRAPMPHPV